MNFIAIKTEYGTSLVVQWDSQVALLIKNPPLSPGLGGCPGGGYGNPLQYQRLENLMDRGDWQRMVHGVIKSLT